MRFLIFLLCLLCSKGFSQVTISPNNSTFYPGTTAVLNLYGIDASIKNPKGCLKANDLQAIISDSLGNELPQDSARLQYAYDTYWLRVYLKIPTAPLLGNYHATVKTLSENGCSFTSINSFAIQPVPPAPGAEISNYTAYLSSNYTSTITFNGSYVDFTNKSSCYYVAVDKILLKNTKTGYLLKPQSVSYIKTTSFSATFTPTSSADTGQYVLVFSDNCAFTNDTKTNLTLSYVYTLNNASYHLYKSSKNDLSVYVSGGPKCTQTTAYFKHLASNYQITINNFSFTNYNQPIYIPKDAPTGKYQLTVDPVCELGSKAFFQVHEDTITLAYGTLYPGGKSIISFDTPAQELKDTSCLTGNASLVYIKSAKSGLVYTPSSLVYGDYPEAIFHLPLDADTGSYDIVFGAGNSCMQVFKNQLRTGLLKLTGMNNYIGAGENNQSFFYTPTGFDPSDSLDCFYATTKNTVLEDLKTGYTFAPISVSGSTNSMIVTANIPLSAPGGKYQLQITPARSGCKLIHVDTATITGQGYALFSNQGTLQIGNPNDGLQLTVGGLNMYDSTLCLYPKLDRFRLVNTKTLQSLKPVRMVVDYPISLYFNLGDNVDPGTYMVVVADGTSCQDTLDQLIRLTPPSIDYSGLVAKYITGKKYTITVYSNSINFLKGNYIPKPSRESFSLFSDSLQTTIPADSILQIDSTYAQVLFTLPCTTVPGKYKLHLRTSSLDIVSTNPLSVSAPSLGFSIGGYDLFYLNRKRKINKDLGLGEDAQLDLSGDVASAFDTTSSYFIHPTDFSIQHIATGEVIPVTLGSKFNTYGNYSFSIPLSAPLGTYRLISNRTGDCTIPVQDTFIVRIPMFRADTSSNFAGRSYSNVLETYYSIINFTDPTSDYYYKNLTGYAVGYTAPFQFPVNVFPDTNYLGSISQNQLKLKYAIPCDAPADYYEFKITSKINPAIKIGTTDFLVEQPYIYLNNANYNDISNPLTPGTQKTISVYGSGTSFLNHSASFYTDSAGLIFRHQSYQYSIAPDQVSILTDNYMQVHLNIPANAPSGSYTAEMGTGFCTIFAAENSIIYDKGKNLSIVLCPISRIRPANDLVERLIVYNNGSENVTNATVKYLIPKNTIHTYNSAYTIAGDTLYIQVPDLLPGASFRTDLTAYLPNTFTLGTLIPYYAFVNVDKDIFPNDNMTKGNLTVTNSLDPNEKRVIPAGNISLEDVQNKAQLDYTVFFQNIGSDTAITVVVTDTLAGNVDLSTFKMLTTSHPYQLQFKDNVITWTFHNIMLVPKMIDDSTSEGFVQFSIQPKTTLQLKDKIDNAATVYFDSNPGLATNMVENIVGAPTAVEEPFRDLENIMQLFPNPNSGEFTLLLQNLAMADELRIVNALGQTIYQKRDVPTQDGKIEFSLPLPKGYYLALVQNRGNQFVTKFTIR